MNVESQSQRRLVPDPNGQYVTHTNMTVNKLIPGT